VGNTLDSFVARFNTALEELDAIEAQFDVTIFRFDWLALEDAIFSDPAAFGLTNVTDAACPGCGFGIPAPGAADTIVPNPDEYLYWDAVHYTRVVHRISGDAAADLVLAGATAHTAAASAAQLEAEVTAPSVHVASVNTAAVLTGNGKLRGGHRYYGTAEVLIVDDFGNPVSGARVTGTFTSNVLRKDETVSSITGPNGLATLSTRNSGSGSTVSFTFCVDDVAASVPYDPAANVMTCDTDTFPD
jgi:hypothetical protein